MLRQLASMEHSVPGSRGRRTGWHRLWLGRALAGTGMGRALKLDEESWSWARPTLAALETLAIWFGGRSERHDWLARSNCALRAARSHAALRAPPLPVAASANARAGHESEPEPQPEVVVVESFKLPGAPVVGARLGSPAQCPSLPSSCHCDKI